jgi:pyrimidine-specific ribonucleoside hydrolase
VPIPVVLDVDTGVDDACALLLAARHPGIDLRAVTCVAGNAPLDDVVRNTSIVLDAAGRLDVPVGRGAARPPPWTCCGMCCWRPRTPVSRSRSCRSHR